MKSTLFSKRIGIAVLAAVVLVIASLAVYGEVIDYKAAQSIKTEQLVHSYSFRSNRTILVHLKNNSVIRLDLTATPLNVTVGTKNTFHRSPGSISKYSSPGKTSGYILTLTPSDYQRFNQNMMNYYGSINTFEKTSNHSELVSVSI
ncbi:hypothetical protein ABWW58_06205 [Sporolactobacillus sp. STCC-11]|uniref:hypothetical protein n=1 Tax=Sporolactobacillus caesalpiniae TaxID=3230362 RepID=UPI003398604D